MKPNDKAYKEFMRVYNKTHVSLEAQIMASLTAAYAAQFPQSEDYAGLVKSLRLCLAYKEKNNRAADALEAVLAERDDFAEQLALRSESGMAKDMQEIMRINNELVAKRDALLARLQAAADSLEKLAGDMRPPNSVTPQLFMLANSIKQNVQQSDRNARLAPEDDEALVDIAAETWIEATTGLARRPSAYTISERAGARAAIAAIRPHIEAAERERCAKAVEKVAERINVAHHERPEWEDGYLQGVHDAAAAIRSGK